MNKPFMFVFILAVAACLPLPSLAQGKARNADLPEPMRSILRVTLDVDSAITVRAKLGATRERSIGSGDDTYASWCYLAADSSALIELMSDRSDMGTIGK